MFARPNPIVPADRLRKFTGTYVSEDKNAAELTIDLQPQGLQATYFGQTANLISRSDTEFYHPGVFFNLTFEKKGLLLETFYGQTQFRRQEARTKKAH
jgi:hypothetical protein